MAALEGGTGGKFRKRPFRRGPATPYDRPPAPARLGLPEEGHRGGGWFSRLVDPASRMIATGATWLFSSVFRKRLGAAPPLPQHEMELEQGVEIHDAVTINPPSLEIHAQEDRSIQTSKRNSDVDGISELEQLLNKKTFTRAEFDRLTELLRSRTVGLSTDSGEQKNEARTSKQAAIPDMEENAGALEKKDDIRTSKLFTSTPKPYSLNLPSETAQQSEERVASPTELAKAYMGSRSLKPALPSTSYSMVRREPAASLSPQFLLKAPETPVGSRSSIQLSGRPENGLRTPRSQGRSALYKMSRSPYFKAQTMASNKGRELSTEGYDGYPRSQLVQSELSLSAGKQPLKRMSSVLDGDLGGIGPIRRIRQKSNLLSSSQKELAASSSGKYITTSENGLQGSVTSIQKSSVADSAKYSNAFENGGKGDRLSFAPHHSSQMAGKILQLVDQMVPSPKKKILELKAGAVESSPKLTIDMLNNQALNSVKDVDPLKLLMVQGNGKMDGGSGSSPLKASNSLASPTQNKAEMNVPLRSIFPGTNALSDGSAMDRVLTTFEAKYGMTKGSTSSLVPDVPSNKPAFKMQAPENSMELDTESQVMKDASSNVAMEKEPPKLSAAGGMFQKSSFVSPPESKPHAGLMPSKEDTQKLEVKVARKDNGFTFPVAPSGSSSQAPPTPSMLVAFSEQSVPQKEEPAAPIFSFGSGSVPTLSFSSTASSITDSSGIKFGITPSSKSQVIVSASASVPTAQVSSSPVVKETKEITETLKPDGDLFPTLSKSTAPVFSFGPSASSSLSNGSLKMTTASSFSSAPTLEPSENLRSISGDSASASVKVPSFPEIPAPTILTTETASSAELTAIGNQSNNLDPKPFRTPLFSTNTVTSAASTTFSSSGSSTIFSFSSTAANPRPSFGSISGQFGQQPGQAAAAASESAPTGGSIFSSSAPASSLVAGGSLFSFGSSGIGSSTSANKSFPFGSSSGGEQSSSMLTSNSSTFGSSSGISFSLPAAAPGVFGSSSSSSFASSALGTNLFSSHSSASFPSPATTSSIFSSTTSQASSSIFGFGSSSSSQSTPSIFGSSASPAVFTFAQSNAAPSSTPIGFGASSSAPFSFTSAASTTSPIFGSRTPITFASSPGNDQMNVEDSMTTDTAQPAMPVMPVFGQTANPPMAQNLAFGSSSLQPSGFQFASQPTPFTPPQSQFQAPGNLEFTAGGSFSLGSGGGDKSARRIVKVKRDKPRKK